MSLLDQPGVRTLPAAEQLALVTTSGRPFGTMDVRLVDTSDTPVTGIGSTGEVQISGPTVFAGYHGKPEATAEAFTADGYFRTGDVARWEAHGYLTICDRVKDMILTGGENVYCVEVERVLADHADVLLVCVYGVPNDFLGEAVKAVVVPKDESRITDARDLIRSLRAHASSLLADYKCPRSYELMTKAQLPMTGSGKVSKAELKKGDAARRTQQPPPATPPPVPFSTPNPAAAAAAAPFTTPSSASLLTAPTEAPPPLLSIEWKRAPIPSSTPQSAAQVLRLLLIGRAGGLASEFRGPRCEFAPEPRCVDDESAMDADAAAMAGRMGVALQANLLAVPRSRIPSNPALSSPSQPLGPRSQIFRLIQLLPPA